MTFDLISDGVTPWRAGSRARTWLRSALCVAIALGALPAPAASDHPGGEQPLKHVLILQSFGVDFEPFNVLSSTFRSELATSWSGPIEFQEVAVLGTPLAAEAEGEGALGDYLTTLYSRRQPDLVVTIGGLAGRFALAHRGHLFPSTPVLFAAIERRMVPAGALTADDALVPLIGDFPGVVETILRVLPRTKTVAIILGSSTLERYWQTEFGRELRPFEDRIRLLWWNGLSAQEVLDRAAALPNRSAIFYTLFLVDAAGVPQADQSVLRRLHEVSTAPIFGLFDSQLGGGIVGGPLIPVGRTGDLSAEAALSILQGAPPAGSRFPAVEPEPMAFDSRELKRWGISERDLPPGSTVRFRAPSPWVEYRWPIAGTVALILALAGLVFGLLIHRSQLRAANTEVRALSRRLLTASENERRWLARELHDDIAQRLARLAIDAARVERAGMPPGDSTGPSSLRDEIARLSQDVHSLSRRLHPSLLDHLGLAEALRAEAERFSEAESVAVDLQLEELADKPSPDAALCLFRVAQESLRNVARHSRAKNVEILLRARDGGAELEVRDNGVGFDPDERRGVHSLGHASMRERVQLVRGRLAIRTTPGRGTSVVAWVPMNGGGL
jgi:signal transduction histidine kinase